MKKKDAFQELADFTEKACATCEPKSQFRCCEALFCLEVAIELERKEIPYKFTGHRIPFMGPKGCTLPPEQRPGCTAYVCVEHLRKRPFRREYTRLCKKAGVTPVHEPAIAEGVLQWTK